jgi:hypothetical protein
MKISEFKKLVQSPIKIISVRHKRVNYRIGAKYSYFITYAAYAGATTAKTIVFDSLDEALKHFNNN